MGEGEKGLPLVPFAALRLLTFGKGRDEGEEETWEKLFICRGG
jgi:hypothetical protein